MVQATQPGIYRPSLSIMDVMLYKGRHTARSTARFALRMVLGTLLLSMAIGKGMDESGFAAVIGTYRLGMPPDWLETAAWAVTAIELALGLWLLSGRDLRLAAWSALILHAGYFVLLVVTVMRGLDLANCGCFGVFLARPLQWTTPLEDLTLVAASAALIRTTSR